VGWRDAAIRGLVWLGLAVTVITEGLGAMSSLRLFPLCLAWFVVLAAAVWLRWRPQWRHPRLVIPAISILDGLAICGILTIIAIVGLIALVSPPNSADAMAYHMPRVVYWAQGHSVAFFPTPYLNQIMLQPLAEYFMLQSFILSGGDQFINCVQWMASIGSIVCVSAIAQLWNAGRRGQVLAALFYATLPNGILQASGAKNDYLLALWLASMTYFAIRFVQRSERRDLTYCGIALGLALLTKATAYLYVPGILIAIFAPSFRKVGWRGPVGTVAILAGCALPINTPQYCRNLSLSGNALGFDSAQGNRFFRWRNERFGLRQTASNIIRNTADQFGARSVVWNQGVYNTAVRLHGWIQADVNDPQTTWRWTTYEPPSNANHEANANNRWHLLLLACVAIALLWGIGRKRPAAAEKAFYILGLLVGFVLFCFYLKWQPFLSRLFLPLFVLAAPVAGAELEKIRPVLLQWVLCLFLANNSRPYLFENWVRPLKGTHSILQTRRDDNYFSDMSQWDNRDSYFSAVKLVADRNCGTVGIDINEFQLEYPFQALLRQAKPRVEFVHTSVDNASSRYAGQGHTQPCAVLCMDCAGKTERLKPYRGFSKQVQLGQFVVFGP
jgi:4-amino-4-deoxy-L-arabinose transferase-like glycosyltransferase